MLLTFDIIIANLFRWSGQLLPDLGLDDSRNGSWFLPALSVLDHSLYIAASQASGNRTLL
jgi:hypothetical protein